MRTQIGVFSGQTKGAGEQVVLRVFVLCLDEFLEELAGVGDRLENDALARGIFGLGGFTQKLIDGGEHPASVARSLAVDRSTLYRAL